MIELLEYVVRGIGAGSAIALVGMGFVVIYRVTNLLNFAQGSFVVLGGITTAILSQTLPVVLAGALAVLCVAAVALVVAAITLLRGEPSGLAGLVITLGISILIQAFLLLSVGNAPYSYAGISDTVLRFGPISADPQYFLVMLVCVVSFLGIELMFARTMVGKALRACAQNRTAAQLVGLRPSVLAFVAFGLSGALGGLAGVLVTPITPMAYYSDVPVAVTAFAAAAFGGFSSMTGALVGGVFLGVAQAVIAGYGFGEYQLVVALLILLLILLWRTRKEVLRS